MGQVVQIRELRQARHRRSERVSMEQCVEVLEWSLKKNLDRYFLSPPEEKPSRSTQIRKLSEVLEYTLRLL
jgi:hypothetical protein